MEKNLSKTVFETLTKQVTPSSPRSRDRGRHRGPGPAHDADGGPPERRRRAPRLGQPGLQDQRATQVR